ncbi:MAG: PH domain-containing protein [Lysinibacillus sp.]
MVYKSKKDSLIGVVIWGVVLFLLYGVYDATFIKENIVGAVVMTALLVLLVSFWFRTIYKIEGDMLHIYYGPFRFQVVISEITSIRHAKNIFTGPSLSIERIEITYSNYRVIQISPKEKEKFVKALLQTNPGIEILHND